MGNTLTEIAQQLKDSNKKVQLIYAFNGTGKTRLSRAFKKLVDLKDQRDENTEERRLKIIYYNAFTEDLFYWDNESESNTGPVLKIHPNYFTEWILKEQGQDFNAIATFQRYTSEKLIPLFVREEDNKKDTSDQRGEIPFFSEVTFSYGRGNKDESRNIKISKGEESCFIWSVFRSLVEQVIEVLNVSEPTDRETRQYDSLEYIFIDDPVSSLDENHLIELAVDVAEMIKSSESNLKFIITTHNPLFYNVLHNELSLSKKGKKEGCYLLECLEDMSYNLNVKYGDSNHSFSYHLYLKQTLEKAIAGNQIQRYHFTLLRNLYEKTANFLGYPRWSELLPDDKQTYYNRIIQFTSHSTLSNETVAAPTDPEKQIVKFLLNHLLNKYGYCQKDAPFP